MRTPSHRLWAGSALLPIGTCLVLAGAVLASAQTLSAELPIAEPLRSQRTCPEAGEGFVRIAGTDVCLRIGGKVEVEASKGVGKELSLSTDYDSRGRPVAEAGVVEIADEFTGLSSDGELTVEAQAGTDFGVLTASIELRGTVDGTELDEGYLSLGGATAGFRSSFFDVGSGYNESAGLSSDRTTNLLAYTAPLGDDLAVTASLEDATFRRFQDGSWAQYAGQRLPDLVGALDWDPDPERGWIHAAVAAHHIRDLRPGSDAAIGWAGMLAAGRHFRYDGGAWGRVLVTGAIARGAIDYLGIPVNTPDYIREKSGALAVTRGLSGLISYQHIWGSKLRSAATASYYRTRTDARAMDWNSEGFWLTLGSEYAHVPGFVLGVDVTYYLDSVRSGAARDASDKAKSVVGIGYIRRRF